MDGLLPILISRPHGIASQGRLCPSGSSGKYRPTAANSRALIMSPNEAIIKAFAHSFEPPLTYVRTERINGKRVADGWTASHWDKDTGLGCMAAVFDGSIRCFMEGAGKGVEAASFYGRAMANAINLAPMGE